MGQTHTVASFALLAAIVVNTPARAQVPDRFNDDGIELLKQVSEGFELNGKTVPPGQFDDAVLRRLQSAADPRIRELATLLPQMKELHDLSRQQNARAVQTLVGQANSLPMAAAERVIEAMKAPKDEQDDLRSAAKTLEAFMGSRRPDEINPQTQMNKGFALAALGNGMAMSLMQKLAAYAHTGSDSGSRGAVSSTPLALDVRLNDDPRRAGSVKITNRGGKPLTHCLVITRLEADKPRIEAMAKQEDRFGAFVLPAMGLSEKTVSGSRLAAKLRYIFFGQDKGGIAFIPEIPVNETITLNLASPSHYSFSKSATASVWCDEGLAENVDVKNWSPTAGNAPRRNAPNGPAASRGTPRPFATRRPGMLPNGTANAARGPLSVGSVWVGTARVGPTNGKRVMQQIELTITERDGDDFKGRIRYNRRNTSPIEGTINNNSVDWQVRVGGQLGLPHSARVNGNRMSVTYSGPSDGDTSVEGTMSLTWANPPRR